MFEIIKRLRKVSKSEKVKKALEFERTEDGRAIIDISLTNIECAYSQYSINEYKIIENGFTDFIEENEKTIPLKNDIAIKIHVDELPTKEETLKIDDAIERHYVEKIVNAAYDFKRNMWLVLSTLFSGIGVLVLIYFLTKVLNFSVVLETVSVLAWVLLWEAFDGFFFKRHNIRTKQIRNYRLKQAQIIFVKNGENNAKKDICNN